MTISLIIINVIIQLMERLWDRVRRSSRKSKKCQPQASSNNGGGKGESNQVIIKLTQEDPGDEALGDSGKGAWRRGRVS